MFEERGQACLKVGYKYEKSINTKINEMQDNFYAETFAPSYFIEGNKTAIKLHG